MRHSRKNCWTAFRRKTEEGIKVRIQTVEKNNGIRAEAVVILGEKECIAPTIYLQEFYEDWKNSGDIERGGGPNFKAECLPGKRGGFFFGLF